MRFSELSEQAQAASSERARRAIESADEALRQSREREIPTEMWQTPAPEPRRPAPKPVRQQRASGGEMTDAWAKWIRGEINRKIEAFAGMLGGEMGKFDKEQSVKLRQEIEDRIGKSDTAVTELLMDMERRVAELEQRLPPAKPRLVGGSDAA
jgi:hypothetical protein